MSKNVKDPMGDRIKSFYENRMKPSLQRRTYSIIRIDGRAFHTYTKGLDRPFDSGLIEDMDQTAAQLCKNIQGAKFAFVQSDEISILVTDFDEIETTMWFDGDVQKIASISASMATAFFNQLRIDRFLKTTESKDISKLRMAQFDARVFQIAFKPEVENYFIWRQNDATKNSISSVGYSLYSNKELENKDSNQKQEMIFQKGINWNNFSYRVKRGTVVSKVSFEKKNIIKIKNEEPKEVTTIRTVWKPIETPIFLQERNFLTNLIP